MKRIYFILALIGLGAAPVKSEKGESGIYNPTGKRDPFRSPRAGKERSPAAVSELERFNVEQYQLRAVLKGLGTPKVMLEDPEGKTHIVREGDSIGRSRATISRILKTEVIVTERTFNYLGAEALTEKVLSLPDEDVPQDIGAPKSTTTPTADISQFQVTVPQKTVSQEVAP